MKMSDNICRYRFACPNCESYFIEFRKYEFCIYCGGGSDRPGAANNIPIKRESLKHEYKSNICVYCHGRNLKDVSKK